ncbi:hydrogenase nickel incorporation protein HypA/HybF [Oceanisphaera litoralis]|uniref:hydrogenase maturation nickel metallochaperone HypA/HybF n=1 Tax=Oceanisphaera litoralis TaxID=225144 RepID=UPI00195DD9FC|nr:hydrogenase maturation nickel metallochaperone HypA [Oceanisphaera litoralis]MBM7457103.1 hydrogenase nickel incorporation protein HypA/HybF [Oceanisphaera litoralis]
MHELSVVRALLNQLEPYQDRDISRIRIEVGTLSCVDGERLQFCFDMVKGEAGLSDTELFIDMVPAQAECRACSRRFTPNGPGDACPCGSYDYTLTSGRQLLLTEIGFG